MDTEVGMMTVAGMSQVRHRAPRTRSHSVILILPLSLGPAGEQKSMVQGEEHEAKPS